MFMALLWHAMGGQQSLLHAADARIPNDTEKDRVRLRDVFSGLIATDQKQVHSAVEAICTVFSEVDLCVPLGSSVAQRRKKSSHTLRR